MPGKLFLLPNLLTEEDECPLRSMPSRVGEIVPSLDGLIAESEKGARRYLKKFPFPEGRRFQEVPIYLLNEHTKQEEITSLLEPLLQGKTLGLISDAGLPCLADPGAPLVFLARQKDIEVEAIPGPSSLILALMLSGLSAQKFSFLGYLDKDVEKRRFAIKQLEKESKQKGMTQVFIEAPYRSAALLTTLLETLEESTQLSVSTRLTYPDEMTITLPIRLWKKMTSP
ncbi:MAG: SAM-dependent methyltransferase [Chlamydiae bacterium]|nr:SAM-dependent methyltransferase [Chlamydiota bacterium]